MNQLSRMFLVLLALLVLPGADSEADPGDLLPPLVPWKGTCPACVAPEHPWATPFERSGFVETPGYDETVRWLQGLAEASPVIAVVSLGGSAQGREIVAVAASREGAFTAEAARASTRPLLMVQAGIHAGEIDGKDAGMMLLRELAFGRAGRLLRKANFLFVPILNVDGHERCSPFNRVNQRGPRCMGWRTNGRNLNLNRDYAKLETPEVRAVVTALQAWGADLYLDIHVTDGIDYQYDITFGFTGPHGSSPAISRWLTERLSPALTRDLEAAGHVPGPLIFAANGKDHTGGIVEWTAPPRFSHGYGDVVHVPTVLVENHSLKPFSRRVFGTYVLLESTLRVLGTQGDELEAAKASDRTRRPDRVVLAWKPAQTPARHMAFKGVAFEEVPSEVSGGTWTRWLGRPVTTTVDVIVYDQPAVVATVPAGYWIPPDWPEVIETLRLHGVQMERIDTPRDVTVEMYRFDTPRFDPVPREGHVRVSADTRVEVRKVRFPAGSVRVPTDQPLGELVVMLLEPAGPDSFFQWGWFHEVLERTEYFEGYALEPLARRMMAQDPELATAFKQALAEDEVPAQDPRARLDWFYQRSPYIDQRWRLYPIGRIPTRRDGHSPTSGSDDKGSS